MDNKTKLNDAITSLQETLDSLKGFTSGDSELPRLVAIARTQIETAELFLSKASDRLPG